MADIHEGWLADEYGMDSHTPAKWLWRACQTRRANVVPLDRRMLGPSSEAIECRLDESGCDPQVKSIQSRDTSAILPRSETSSMTEVDGAWTREELAAFLDAAVVPMRLGCHHPDGGLWMVSLWYRYRENERGGDVEADPGAGTSQGVFECATGAGSDIVSFLRNERSVAFEVSTNRPPYMGVRGSGVTTVSPDEDKAVIESLVQRYLGGTEHEMAGQLLDERREEVRITVEPDRLYTWDFTPRMGEASEDTPAAAGEPESPTN